MKKSAMTIFKALLCVLGVFAAVSKAAAALPFEQLAAASLPRVYNSTEWKNLLHYDEAKSVINKDSGFFLSADGYQNPKAEYFSTLKALSDDNAVKDDSHAVCKYPARFDYIRRSLNLSADDFPQPDCQKYAEYRQKVPADMVYIVFAAENNDSPSSMMGHTFLKLSGTNESGLKEHSFSYFAALDSIDLKFYADILTRGLDGAYVLSPYRNKEDEYLYKEKRSLWEFELDLSQNERGKLKMHLWELKGSNIRYSLISHNCATSVTSILKTANSDYKSGSVKPAVTPLEYIQELYGKGHIKNISLQPSEYTRAKIARYGMKNILEADKASRAELNFHSDYVLLRFMPVYKDILDTGDAYFDEAESKIGEVALGYSKPERKAFIQSLNLLSMRSVPDYLLNHDLSKHFKLSFENDLADRSTNLKPTAEFGLGAGTYLGNTAFYLLPKAGLRYNKYANAYLSPEAGMIVRFADKAKLAASYGYYFNSRGNNRGYDGKYTVYAGYRIARGVDIYAEYSRYFSAAKRDDFSFGVFCKF